MVIVSGIYLFFFLEYVMKMIVRFKQKSSCDDGQKQLVSSKLLWAYSVNIVPLCKSDSTQKVRKCVCGVHKGAAL